MLNSELGDLKACVQKQELQLHSKVQELKEAAGKVSSNYCIITGLSLSTVMWVWITVMIDYGNIELIVFCI